MLNEVFDSNKLLSVRDVKDKYSLLGGMEASPKQIYDKLRSFSRYSVRSPGKEKPSKVCKWVLNSSIWIDDIF